MSKTSVASKNKWNSKNYDRCLVTFRKGGLARLKAAAKAEGISVNRFIIESINARTPNLLMPLDNTSKQKKSGSAEKAAPD